MNKKIFAALLLAAALFPAGNAQQPPQKPPAMKPEDVQKALSLVDQPQPVAADLKAGFDSIDPVSVKAMLEFAASDWTEGRETGTRGWQLAADYAVSLLQQWGLKPGGDKSPTYIRYAGGQVTQMGGERTFFQDYALREVSDVKGSLGLDVRKGETVKSRTFRSGVDFSWYTSGSSSVSAPVVFAGYGIQESKIGWDELKNLNVKGKILLILSEAPGKDDPGSPFQAKELKDKYFPPSGPQVYTPGMRRFNKTSELAKLGPAAILVVSNTGRDSDLYKNMAGAGGRPDNKEQPFPSTYNRRLSLPGAPLESYEMGPTVISVSREIADAILEGAGTTIDALKTKIETTRKPASMEVPGTRLSVEAEAKTSLLKANNIIAVLEGSDPKLKDEYVVIGAHYDHLGMNGDMIWNGADDNASGSIGVLALARAMALNPRKPKRSVVFCLWSGEEMGLFGSRYYVMSPVYPLAKTVGTINFDMISRAFDDALLARQIQRYKVPGTEELIKKIRPASFAGVEFSKDSGLAEIQRQANAQVGLDLDLRERAFEAASGGSDHNPFAKVKIPYVYYDAAMTSDYHRVSDSVEKVSAELMAKIIRMGYLTAFALADK